MTEGERFNLLQTLLNKTHGREPWFDYSPADVMFYETIRELIEEKKHATKD